MTKLFNTKNWPAKEKPRIKVTLDDIFGKGAEERYKKKFGLTMEMLLEKTDPDTSHHDWLEMNTRK